MFLDRVIHFGNNLGDQVKGRSPKKIKSLIEVTNGLHVRVEVLEMSIDTATIINKGSLRRTPESTGSKLQHEPYLFSVACP